MTARAPGALDRLSDRALCAWASAALLLLSAWPLLLARVPPLQDLPAHLAAAVVLKHPGAYPDLVPTGFFKTNSALFLALWAAPEAHLYAAAKACVLAVLAAHAWVLPRLVLELGGRARVVPASLAAIPLVHGWFVAMGMLDYALAAALGLEWVRLAARQRREPRASRLAWMAALGVFIWYTHAFVVAALGLVVLLDAARTRRLERGAWLALAPAAALTAGSVLSEALRTRAPSGRGVVYRPPWETVYDLWAQHAWAFTKLELGSLAAAVFLAWAFWRGRGDEPPVLGALAAWALLALHFALPVEAHDWFAVNARLLPFLYACALVRVPERPPRWVLGALAAAGVSVSAGLGWDYARLDRDFAELAAGVEAVPRGATMFPLMFDAKGSSENTRALVNAWGLYVVERRTSAPLLFAHSPSFPVRYASEPPPELHQLRLGGFAQAAHEPEEWRAFLAAVEPRFDVLLVWGAPPAGFAPAEHAAVFERGRVLVLRRP